MDSTVSKPSSTSTLTEMLDYYAVDGWKPVTEVTEQDRSVWIQGRMGGAYLISPDNYGVTVVLGGHYWGKGATLEEAKANFKRQGGRLSGGYTVLRFPAETLFMGVDGMGRVSWDGERPAEREVPAKGKRR